MAPRNPERLAFLLHRATGLVLVAYFTLHSMSMASLLAGWGCCSGLAALLVASKPIRFLVAAAAGFHGLNGLRLLLVEVLALGLGRPGIPRPPYVSGSLRAGQRLMLHLVFLAWMLVLVAAAAAA